MKTRAFKYSDLLCVYRAFMAEGCDQGRSAYGPRVFQSRDFGAFANLCIRVSSQRCRHLSDSKCTSTLQYTRWIRMVGQLETVCYGFCSKFGTSVAAIAEVLSISWRKRWFESHPVCDIVCVLCCSKLTLPCLNTWIPELHSGLLV